jgi:hypothetical protein
MQAWSTPVVQVTPEAQLGTGLQIGQLSGGPAILYRPPVQLAHCESPAPEQATSDEQPGIAVHATQTRLLLLVQAVA